MTAASPSPRARRLDQRGIALLLTLLLALLVVSLAIGVLLMMSNTTLVTRFHLVEASMSNLAAGGLEQARDTLNGTPNLLPRPTGFVTLELDVPLSDADNNPIPGVTRSTYAGLTGNVTGQLGLYATVLSVISNSRGPVVVRRADLRQESFAQYSRFFNVWSCCAWDPHDVSFGLVHSNQGITLGSGAPGTTFWGEVTTVGAIANQGNGTFNGGVRTGVTPIPFPTLAALNSLQPLAAAAGLVVPSTLPNVSDPEVRVEFLAIDLNGDGDTADQDEGYFRVFQASASTPSERNYVTAREWADVSGAWAGVTGLSDPNIRSPNCGGRLELVGGPTWLTADSIVRQFGADMDAARDSVRRALNGPFRRCYLGGDRALFGGLWVTITPYGSFQPWAGWGGSPPAALVAALASQGVSPTTDPTQVALTFWPLSQAQNSNSRGVIFVTGSVAVSGRVRGRVTLVARGNIMLADDITYVQAPNTKCVDILGLISTGRALVENNNVNTPFRVGGAWTTLFDDTPDEFLHGFFLTLQHFSGEDLSGGAEPRLSPEHCGGSTGDTSRGCRVIVGGIAQGTMPSQGGTSSHSGWNGWGDQDGYDQCGTVNPPPYYPTTGRFTKYRYYEIDPVGFTPAAWFAANQ